MILKNERMKITLGDLQEILQDLDLEDIPIETILELVTKKHMINESYEEA